MVCRAIPSLCRSGLYTRGFTDISANEALYSQPSVDLVMVAVKALLVLLILSGAVAAGVVYTVYQDTYFTIEMKLTDARLDGDDILVSVQLTMENRGDVNIVLQRVLVTVMSPDKTIAFVTETLIPPQVIVPAHGSATLIVQDIRIRNVESLGTSVLVMIDAEWTAGADEFSIHVERPFDVGSL